MLIVLSSVVFSINAQAGEILFSSRSGEVCYTGDAELYTHFCNAPLKVREH